MGRPYLSRVAALSACLVRRGRVPGQVILPDVSTLRRYCCHNPNTRIYRTDQNDSAEGLSESNAAESDDIVIRTNGTMPEVQALEGGEPFEVTTCSPSCED